jgi:acetyl-CoA synthetase
MTARPPVIRKSTEISRVRPHLGEYAATVATFSWPALQAELGSGPGTAFNMAWLAVDRWARSDRAAHTALRCIGRSGAVRQVSYAELAVQAARFANVLGALGVGAGDRVFVLLARTPELYSAALGTLRNGSVLAPLYSAFGPEPLRTRLCLGEARVLVTTESLYRRRVAAIVADVPTLKHVLVVADGPSRPVIAGTRDFAALMAAASDRHEAAATAAEDPALLHFTSGTTGRPKGAVHVHGAALMHYMTGKYALDLHPDDVFWCTADPGWVTGTSYGILAPLLHGVTNVVDEGDFDAERWYRILAEQQVSVWYTAPTAIRMLMKVGPEPARRWPRPALRFVASVGEPLNAEAVWWGLETLGLPIHDNWWQTETGGIVIGNTPSQDIKPGSMGRPLPGVTTAILRHDGDRVAVIDAPGIEGELAIRPGWPSMFRGYLHEDERYRKCFTDGWYLSGDLAKRDADGYYWFIGRADDVIKSSGHLIGPFEVESVLMEDPAVAEAGVIGKPDPVVGEMVKAFVSLKAGCSPDEELRTRLLAHARRRLGASIAPKEIEFVATLPRTRSGKIMRRLLRARELGLPEGDISTLEGAA